MSGWELAFWSAIFLFGSFSSAYTAYKLILKYFERKNKE
jgi:hypothetical protein